MAVGTLSRSDFRTMTRCTAKVRFWHFEKSLEDNFLVGWANITDMDQLNTT